MTGTVTITFSRAGVKGPVYLTTQMSKPPWKLQAMSVREDKTSAGDLIFYQQFAGVPPGSYHYKVRIGDSEWVLDDKMLKATDNDGNHNNIYVVPTEKAPNMLQMKDSECMVSDFACSSREFSSAMGENSHLAKPEQSSPSVADEIPPEQDSTFDETPSLPHEMLSSTESSPTTTHTPEKQSSPPMSNTPRSTPRRRATPPMETIAESVEPEGSAPDAPKPASSASSSKINKEMDRYRLHDHSSGLDGDDSSTQTPDTTTTDANAETYVQLASALPYEGELVPCEEEEAPLLAHERSSPVLYEADLAPDIRSPIAKGLQQTFQFDPATETPSQPARQPLVLTEILTGNMDQELQDPSLNSHTGERVNSPDQVVALRKLVADLVPFRFPIFEECGFVDTSSPLGEPSFAYELVGGGSPTTSVAAGKRPTDPSLDGVSERLRQQSLSGENVQKTDDADGWSRALARMSTPRNGLGLVTPPHSLKNVSSPMAGVEGITESSVTAHDKCQTISESMEVSSGLAAAHGTAMPTPGHPQPRPHNYFRVLLGGICACFRRIFEIIFSRNKREISRSHTG